MKKYILMDSPVMKMLNKIMNLFLLNICFLIGCIPIVTTGVSWMALYSVNMKMCREEEGYILRDFCKAYKDNLKNGWKLFVCLFLFFIICRLDLWALSIMDRKLALFFKVFLSCISAVVFLLQIYVSAYLARYEDSFLDGMKNSIRYIVLDWRYASGLFFINGIFFISTFISPTMFAALGFLWMIIGFALLNYCNSKMLRTLFEKIS